MGRPVGIFASTLSRRERAWSRRRRRRRSRALRAARLGLAGLWSTGAVLAVLVGERLVS